MWRVSAIAAGALFLTACSANSGMSTGAIPGANPGIVVGSRIAAGAGEKPIGPVEGGLMGAGLAARSAMPTGQSR